MYFVCFWILFLALTQLFFLKEIFSSYQNKNLVILKQS